MTETDDPLRRQMSLIPYPYKEGAVVLRRGSAVVLYNAESRQLTVRDTKKCPHCGQAIGDGSPQQDETSENEHADSTAGSGHIRRDKHLMDPRYFEMLAASQHPTPTGSAGPATPNRLFPPPALRSGRSRDVSGNQDPPTGAAFLGSEPHASAGQGISSKAFSPGFFKQFFREIKELGRGGNGVVLLVEHLLDDVSLGLFACKRIPVGNDHRWLEKVLVEVTLLKNISHPNLIAYHFAWLEDHQPTKFGPSVPCLWILQRYCDGGDLHSYVIGPHQASNIDMKEQLKERMRSKSKSELDAPEDLHGPSKLTFDEIFLFFRDIASGLHYLHSQGYIHRDLKPSNCLLVREANKTKILISDFGEVQVSGVKRGSTGATGTISYCAPEVLRQKEDGTFGEFTTKSDIFSLGMIVYFMCFGRLPYSNAGGIDEENEDLDELRAEIMQWTGFNDDIRTRTDLPERLYRYLKRLLSVDPGDRPSTEEILASIRAGPGFGENTPTEESGSPRVVSLDASDWQPTSGARSPRQAFSRSTSRREAPTPRLQSPLRHRHGVHARDEDASTNLKSKPSNGASVVVRPRKMEVSTPLPSPPVVHSPRLLLPPPEDYGFVSFTRQLSIRSSYTIPVLRVASFVIKILTMSVPCAPFATNPWVQYPLLALAVLDVGILSFHLRRAVILLALHFTSVTIASQRGRLCEGRSLGWG